jgi:GNAT superfamily N-acetyltransferase
VGDHAAFVRLFPELAVDDPMMAEEKFNRELLPTTLIAEAGEGPDPTRILGYAYFQILEGLAYVRHLVTAPEARRRGVGRALMDAVAEIARAAGCTSWCLNVKPDNTAALALYTAVGLSRGHTSKAFKLQWSKLDAVADPVQDARIEVRPIEAHEDAAVETSLGLLRGILSSMRVKGGRAILALRERETSAVVGAAVFDPAFPGANPFCVTRPELAFVMLRALRAHADPSHELLHFVVEGHPDVADAVLAAGATLKLDIVNMSGPLTP